MAAVVRPDGDPATGAAPRSPACVIIGAGPAGLTAAYALTNVGLRPTVLESDEVVGGIARTVERDGWRFDIGGHRFYTKVNRIEDLWKEILPAEHWLTRPRMSRILYGGKFFDYPLRIGNVLRNLGPIEATRCVGSYLWARVHPPLHQDTFEGWVSLRFGRRLYQMFFESYTEKVWGVHPSEIRADWAAQRIKDLSLRTALSDALFRRRRSGPTTVSSLITEFDYPAHGPGMLWERCAELTTAAGAEIQLGTSVTSIERTSRATAVLTIGPDGNSTRHTADHVISSMPLGTLVEIMEPPAPDHVREAADGLEHRDFLTVAIVVPEAEGFPDNWIYVHSPDVVVGRIQNFGAWSPYMVRDGATCLGLEYFVTEGDELWRAHDDELVAMAVRELGVLGLVKPEAALAGYVVRMPKAYPVYDTGYAERVEIIRRWLEDEVPNVHPVGRNGMHKYNNQDHSMLTALLTVENIVDGAHHDIWAVNVEQDYLEDRSADGSSTTGPTSSRHGTGRDAPIVPTGRRAS